MLIIPITELSEPSQCNVFESYRLSLILHIDMYGSCTIKGTAGGLRAYIT